MGTLNSGQMVVHIDSAKMPEYEESISHLTMGSCPTISHTFLVLSTQSMGSP